MQFGFITTFDMAILNFFNEHLHLDFLAKIFMTITKLGDEGIFWIALAVMFLFDKSTRKTAIKMGIALLLGLALGNGVLKHLINRPRPWTVNHDLIFNQAFVDSITDASFPSGHTLASFEAAGVLMICDKKRYGIIALVYAILIAFSRIYLRVHYPSDVLAGVILGLLFAFVACKAVDLVTGLFSSKKKSKRKS